MLGERDLRVVVVVDVQEQAGVLPLVVLRQRHLRRRLPVTRRRGLAQVADRALVGAVDVAVGDGQRPRRRRSRWACRARWSSGRVSTAEPSNSSERAGGQAGAGSPGSGSGPPSISVSDQSVNVPIACVPSMCDTTNRPMSCASAADGIAVGIAHLRPGGAVARAPRGEHLVLLLHLQPVRLAAGAAAGGHGLAGVVDLAVAGRVVHELRLAVALLGRRPCSRAGARRCGRCRCGP